MAGVDGYVADRTPQPARRARARLIDEKFKTNKLRYVLQCALAGVAMAVVLILLTPISNAAVIAALGASSFIAFGLPYRATSRTRFLIGGYVAGVVAGGLCFWLRSVTPLPAQLGVIPAFPNVVFGAIAVAAATFVMVVTNTEHPPAVGLALGFVLLDEWRWITVIAVMAGIVTLCVVKVLLKSVLRDLL